MKYIRIVFLLLMAAQSVSGAELTVRASRDCCEEFPDFNAGSKAYLISDGKVVSQSVLSQKGPFVFYSVYAGKYDMLLAVSGYDPVKFQEVEIGRDGVYEFEFVPKLRPVSDHFLPNQIRVRFSPILPNNEIKKKLNTWNLQPVQISRVEDPSKPLEHLIKRGTFFCEVIASIDSSRSMRDAIVEILTDPSVVECTPFYLVGH